MRYINAETTTACVVHNSVIAKHGQVGFSCIIRREMKSHSFVIYYTCLLLLIDVHAWAKVVSLERDLELDLFPSRTQNMVGQQDLATDDDQYSESAELYENIPSTVSSRLGF